MSASTAVPHYLCYIDESGDEGYKLDQGSSPCFFLSAIIVRAEDERLVRGAVDEVKQRVWLSKGKDPPKVLHWKALKHEQKVVVCQALRHKAYCQVAVGIRKRLIRPETWLTDSGYLYRYAARFLLERVSWYVANAGGWADITFSNRARFRRDKLSRYLEQVLGDPRSRLKPVFDPNRISVGFPYDTLMLQVADACASAVAAAFNPDYYGNTHSVYCEALSSKLYRYRGKMLSYGLKLFPDEGCAEEYPFVKRFR